MSRHFHVDDFRDAFHTRDIREFLRLMMPPEWQAISARIIETGATMSEVMTPWAPRWTQISPTVRYGNVDVQTHIKSCIYRMHDCLHQLWGLPVPSAEMSEDDFYLYKRAQMCGEVAVLTLTEFAFVDIVGRHNPILSAFLETRNALPMMTGPLRGKTISQIAARLDDLLHKKRMPRWARESLAAIAFAEDYVPMLEEDRRLVDANWEIMVNTGWRPVGLPNSRYSHRLDGLELTIWMIDDFYHLIDTDHVVDEALAEFNRERRSLVTLPQGWR